MAALQCLKDAYKKDGDALFSRACCDRTRACCDRTRGHGFTLKEGTVGLDIRKEFFTMTVVKPWHKFPSEVVEAPSLETFKVGLDRALRDLI